VTTLRRTARRLIPAAALVLGAGLLLVTPLGSAGAEEAEGTGEPGACTAAERRTLVARGDNFSAACDLPGQVLGDVGSEQDTPAARAGTVRKSANIRQVARLPKTGDFADDEAFGTDLAFKGKYAFGGNYDGFTVYDVSKPGQPRRVTQVSCPGSQNDVSVYRDLLVLSVDSTRSTDTCDNTSVPGQTPTAWEGLRVFDISKPWKPRFLTSVKTECGSHTHTLAPSRSGKDVFAYVSSYGPSATLPNCQPPHDSISVVRIPVDAGEDARVVATPNLFPDGGGAGGDGSSATSGCHDITAYPSKDIAAGACMGDGILLDIANRSRPKVTDRVRDTENFAFWHSATFNNAGTKVVFTDELGGGGAATCNDEIGAKRGADGIYDLVRGQLVFRSYYKMPRTQSDTENCVAHNGSLIPVAGRDIMVQAWYQGGTSVFDFTDSANPREIAYFDRGAISDDELVLGGSWSSYWYDGAIYSNDITRGLEVFRLDTAYAKKASKVRYGTFNAQSQPSFNG